MTDKYNTISNSISEGFYSDKRSKFLAFAHHVETADEALSIVKQYKKKYYDARHCCYAYRLGAEGQEFRMNDDGEPSSTAGKPIFGQIVSAELTDVLICFCYLWLCFWVANQLVVTFLSYVIRYYRIEVAPC